MHKTLLIMAAAAAALSARCGDAFEHCIFDSIPLDGEWEMSYLPYAWESVTPPEFAGVAVQNAVPGYWEDMEDAFRKAGMKCEFRRNPLHSVQTLPITGSALDTTLPNIYGCFLYRRMVRIESVPSAAFLAFEGVRNQVHVWVNGMFAGLHEGFSTPFEVALPRKFLYKGENEIVLAVSNNPNTGYNGGQVSGLSTRAVFRATGGVNGSLELRIPKGDIADVHVTTAADLASFTVHVAGRADFRYRISGPEGVKACGEATGDFTLPAAGYSLWSPENPALYTLELSTGKGSCRRRFGVRKLAADGEKLRLNGRPVYLRGVTEHCYFPHTVHLPRDLGYYRMITAKRKELGFNFVRFHTFIPPDEYLQATDELGMLVQVETPNFVPEREFAAIVAFARRHPSVVIYCTGNETRIDRMAETYLEDVAGIVHRGTDAMFSPMSAMRGVEYAVMRGLDPSVDRPFRHNAERISRLSAYSDLFNSYQLGLTSYDSLNSGTAEELDSWGDAYCGKPRLSHEICIDGSYADLSLEDMYPPESPLRRSGLFAEVRRVLTDRGLVGRAGTYFRNSCEWMRRIRKHCFEKMRAADRTAGYDFLGDINTHWHTFGYSVGMMDEFYRLKPGESVENVLRYNSAAVLLSDLGSDFCFTAGAVKKVRISISNYDSDAKSARLRLALLEPGGAAVWSAGADAGDVPSGRLSHLASFDVPLPAASGAAKYLLHADFTSDAVSASNEWEIYAFPEAAGRPAPADVRVAGDISKEDLLAAMERGERVLLLGAGPFRSLPLTFRIGLAGRCAGNYATVIKPGHPALDGMPHEGWCGWQFRRLMEGGRAVQLEAGVPFDPVIDIASSVKMPIRQAALFEYRVGRGRFMACSFKFGENDPAARWFRARLEDYAASDAFNPAQSLTPEQLRAVIDAPLLSGSANTNRARNPNDPSGDVRAGSLARP